jgi:hypothetical protein
MSDLVEMTVTDGNGTTTGLEGTCGRVTMFDGKDDPYRFYAAENPNGADSTGNQVTQLTKQVKQVTMVMPLGGSQTGLYRFPRIGEKVLVLDGGANYYMMGYIPTTDQPFYDDTAYANTDADTDAMRGFEAKQKNPGDMQDFLQDNGMAFRYKRDAKNAGSGAFSEIGFYQKNAKWPTTRDGNASYERQDAIAIQSTGDIESRAENYHLVKARRLEILAGDAAVEISPGKRIENANSDSWSEGEAPLGDHVLDDPEIHKGDIHIRAGKRVIIKAEDEIRLQVGRTTLVINDKGFSVVSKKINSNVPTTFDSSLSLDARTGISMFGQTVGINAGHGFSLKEGMGGVVSSTAGVLSLGGREVKAASANAAAQIYSCIMYGMELALNGATAGVDLGSEGKTLQRTLYGINKTYQLLKILGNAGYLLADGVRNYRNYTKCPEVDGVAQDSMAQSIASLRGQDIKDRVGGDVNQAVALIGLEPFELLSNFLGFLLTLTNTVYAAVDSAAKFTSNQRDAFNYAAMVADNAIVELFVALMLSCPKGSTPATLRLRSNGDAVIKAATNRAFYATEAKSAAATATIVPEGLANFAKIVFGAGNTLVDIGKLTAQTYADFDKKMRDLNTEEL